MSSMSLATAFAVGAACGWYASLYFASKPRQTNQSEEEDESLIDSLNMEGHKMVLGVRTDLKMGKGKIAAQCGHAVLGCYKRAERQTPTRVTVWENTGQKKITLKVSTEEELLNLAEVARSKGLCSYIVHDAGHTQVAPNTRTVLAIGPGPESHINAVTSHLKIL